MGLVHAMQGNGPIQVKIFTNLEKMIMFFLICFLIWKIRGKQWDLKIEKINLIFYIVQ